jgi:hypothetical protein
MLHVIHKMVALRNISVVVRTYVLVLKQCTVVAPGTFGGTVWRNYVLGCLGKCLLKRNVVHC